MEQLKRITPFLWFTLISHSLSLPFTKESGRSRQGLCGKCWKWDPATGTRSFADGRCEKIELILFHLIPAKAGIQCFQSFNNFLDPGFHPAMSGTKIQFFHTFRVREGGPPSPNWQRYCLLHSTPSASPKPAGLVCSLKLIKVHDV